MDYGRCLEPASFISPLPHTTGLVAHRSFGTMTQTYRFHPLVPIYSLNVDVRVLELSDPHRGVTSASEGLILRNDSLQGVFV